MPKWNALVYLLRCSVIFTALILFRKRLGRSELTMQIGDVVLNKLKNVAHLSENRRSPSSENTGLRNLLRMSRRYNH